MTDADPASVEVNMKVHAGPGLNLGKMALLAVGAVGTGVAIAWRVIRAVTPVPRATVSPSRRSFAWRVSPG